MYAGKTTLINSTIQCKIITSLHFITICELSKIEAWQIATMKLTCVSSRGIPVRSKLIMPGYVYKLFSQRIPNSLAWTGHMHPNGHAMSRASTYHTPKSVV